MSRHRVLALIQAAVPVRGWTSSPVSGPSPRCRSPASTSCSTSRCRTSRTLRCHDVWLSVQYQAATLEEQAADGRPWDLDRTRGGLRLLVPQEGAGTPHEDGFAHGNADLLFQIRAQVAAFDPTSSW